MSTKQIFLDSTEAAQMIQQLRDKKRKKLLNFNLVTHLTYEGEMK